MGLHALWRVSVSRATPAEAPPTFSNSFIGIQVGELRASEPYSCLFTQLCLQTAPSFSPCIIYMSMCVQTYLHAHTCTHTHISNSKHHYSAK